MTPELIAIIAVGVAMAGLWLTTLQIVLKRMDRLDDRMDRIENRMDRIESRMNRIEDRMDRLETRMGHLEQRQAKLEGLLDGLREALFERASR